MCENLPNMAASTEPEVPIRFPEIWTDLNTLQLGSCRCNTSRHGLVEATRTAVATASVVTAAVVPATVATVGRAGAAGRAAAVPAAAARIRAGARAPEVRRRNDKWMGTRGRR